MNDTPLEIEEKIRELVRKKTIEERLKMGCSMYDLSKQLVTQSILRSNPRLSPAGLRRELFLKFYGNDFDSKKRLEILERLVGVVE